MTAGGWEAYGDASASHQTVTIEGVTYTSAEVAALADDEIAAIAAEYDEQAD